MPGWIFQGTPDLFDVDAYVRRGGRILWTVKQKHYAPRMRLGDRVFLWRSKGGGQEPAGIVGVGTIRDLPRPRPEEPAAVDLWRSPEDARGEALRVEIELEPARTRRFVPRDVVAADPALRDLTILRMATATNYPLTPDQEGRLLALWIAVGSEHERIGIPAGITAEDIRQAIQDFDHGVRHEFADSTKYDLIVEDRRYPPKAIVGLAARRVAGRVLGPQDFKGGLDSRCFDVLESAGFTIAPKVSGGAEWSHAELEAAVEAYVRLLEAEARGESVNKAEVNRALREGPIPGRTRGSIEFRMQNISAVIEGLGGKWVSGYKPARNVGATVQAQIRAILEDRQPELLRHVLPTDNQSDLEQRTRALRGRLTSPPSGAEVPRQRTGDSKQFVRLPQVRAWVLDLAEGRCELCAAAAPFVDGDGEPYLEVHHVVTLASGGPDTISNAVALCPNCHRRLHLAKDRKIQTDAMYAKVQRLQRPIAGEVESGARPSAGG